MALADVLEELTRLPLEQFREYYESAPLALQQQILRDALKASDGMLWVPNPGPQYRCFYCEADETLFGGEPGGGKSQVGIGLAVGPHERSLLLRRTATEATKFVGELEDVIGNRDGYNGRTNEWRLGHRLIDIGGCQWEDDKQKYKGSPHDLIFFDELTDFSETQYRFIGMWNRSTRPGQRCRIVGATNGPSTPEGMWVVKRWAAWLDPTHPYPAGDGELRWYYTDEDGNEIEDTGPNERVILGRTVRSRSRTFIRSRLADNPDLAATDYGSHLMSQEKELRRVYALGDFGAMMEDRPYQCIPTDWVKQAQARWTPQPPPGVPMCAVGFDVSMGGTGSDDAILARRHDAWFAKLVAMPNEKSTGKEDTQRGAKLAAFALAHRLDGAKIVVDVGGGWGADALAHLSANQVDAVGYMGVKKSFKRSKDMKHGYRNVRTEAHMQFRDALNPDQPGGSQIALPDDRLLLADLTAADMYVTAAGIELEAKDAVKARLGRSPDRGDAVVMAWWAGARMASDWHNWPASKSGMAPAVNGGRVPLTRRIAGRA